MNIIRKFIARQLAKGALAISGEWEGHTNSRRHKTFPSRILTSQDYSLESRMDREQIISAARILCQIFGLGNRILRTYANYVVGGDCEVSFHTEDEAWNDLAAQYMADRGKLIDTAGREDLAGLARQAVIHTVRDGDVGFIKVRPVDGEFVMLEAIEADRIGPSSLSYLDRSMIGGVRKDAFGRPQSYLVAKRSSYGGFEEPAIIPASSFIHVFDNMRFDASRGVSFFSYGALGRARSLRDLIECEETGVATANKWAVIKEMANAANPSGLGLTLSDDEAETPVDPAVPAPKVEELFDGMIQTIEPGEKIHGLESSRPSTAWQGFIQFLIHDCAISMDLPFEFVWSMSGLTGPGVRMASRQAERTFRQMWRVILRRFLNPAIGWVIADGIESGRLPFHPGWFEFSVQRSDHPTIDVGRESQANVAEYDKGWTTGLEIAGERGQNIWKVMRQKARELQYAAELEKEFGLPPGSIVVATKAAIAGTPEPAKEDEEIYPNPAVPSPGKPGGNGRSQLPGLSGGGAFLNPNSYARRLR